MNQVALGKRDLRCKTPIVVLSLVSLICTVLGCIRYFIIYSYSYKNGYKYVLEGQFPGFWEWLSFLVTLAPCVLLVLYVLKFYSQFKADVLVPVTFGVIAMTHIVYLLESYYVYYASLAEYYGDIINFSLLLPDLVLAIAIFVSFGLVMFSLLMEGPHKIFLIVATAVGVVIEAISLCSLSLNLISLVTMGRGVGSFLQICEIAGAITLYVALFLLTFKNRTFVKGGTSREKETKSVVEMNPEQALKLLKNKLDLGVITEEQYREQRAEIISKL